jgi:hypothetical protein
LIVFLLGVGLIVISGIVALKETPPFSSWSSWITGGGGVLAVIYGRFIAQPRAQVEDSVQYLSGLKAVFLGYLRQLRQTDQAYTRRVLEDRPLDADETKGFNDLIEQTMERSVRRLTAKRNSQANNASVPAEPHTEAGSSVPAEPQTEGSADAPGH